MSLFEGEMDWPLPNNAGMMMKYFFGFSVLSSPISQTLSDISFNCQSVSVNRQFGPSAASTLRHMTYSQNTKRDI